MKTVDQFRPPKSFSPEVIDELVEKNNTLVGKNKKLALHKELMQIKKERNKKNSSLRPLLFNIGMALSLALVIVAINWKSYNVSGLVDLGELQADVDEIIEIPISQQPPPPPPPKQDLFRIEVVSNTEIVEELNINIDVEVTEETALEVIEIVDFEEEVADEVFTIVEEKPTPQGGIEEFYRYLASELRYPSSAMRQGVSGMVFVQFVIEKDGSITQVEVVKGISPECDKEAIRVIEKAPAWNPGKQRGVLVRVKQIISVRFVLKMR